MLVEPRELPRKKKVVFSIIYVICMILCLVVVGEVALRILPLGRYRSSVFRQYDPVLGESLIPNTKVVHNRSCFTGEVIVNRWGWRDIDRLPAKPPGWFRIAVIGDSAVEAAQVKQDEVFNIRMEQLLRQQGYKNVEVLAFGIGGVGTLQELMMYKLRIRRFHPDLVVLMFSDNDVLNNSEPLQNQMYGIHTWYCPYYVFDPDGRLEFHPVQSMRFGKMRAFVESRSLLVYYLEHIWAAVDIPLGKWKGIPILFGYYSDDPLDQQWKDAWTLTDEILALMNQAVTADGAQFIVLAWADFPHIDTHWRERMTSRYGYVPSEFNPDKPYERLRDITSRDHILFDTLASYMMAYRDQHNLTSPYFSFTCDPHYSALGHEVAAEAIVQKLAEYHLLHGAQGTGSVSSAGSAQQR